MGGLLVVVGYGTRRWNMGMGEVLTFNFRIPKEPT